MGTAVSGHPKTRLLTPDTALAKEEFDNWNKIYKDEYSSPADCMFKVVGGDCLVDCLVMTYLISCSS